MPDASEARRFRRGTIVPTALAVILIVLGAIHWFEPFLTRRAQPVVSVTVPPALDALSFVELAHGQPVCMSGVTIPSNSRFVQFTARPASTRATVLPTLEVVLTGTAYRASALDRRGVPGVQNQPISAPHSTLVGSICLVDRDRRPIELYGTAEARTLTRSQLTVAGKPSTSEVSMQFLGGAPRSLLERLGEVFGHASELTDGVIPPWLVWTLAVIVALGAPVALLAAFFQTLRELPDSR